MKIHYYNITGAVGIIEWVILWFKTIDCIIARLIFRLLYTNMKWFIIFQVLIYWSIGIVILQSLITLILLLSKSFSLFILMFRQAAVQQQSTEICQNTWVFNKACIVLTYFHIDCKLLMILLFQSISWTCCIFMKFPLTYASHVLIQ